MNRLKQYIKTNPKIKQLFLKLLFRPKPFTSRVRRFIWLFTILPRYFNRCVSWSSRLDLVPFHSFRLGRYAKLEKDVVINNGMGDVVIGEEAQIGIGSVIIGPIRIGKYCGLSQYVRLLGMHHGMDPDRPHHHHACSKAPIELGEDVFIGTGTVVMGKKNGDTLRLGDYCRIGANSVVMDDIPPYTVAVGNPAKVVRAWDFNSQKWKKVGSEPISDNQISKLIASSNLN
ncbi:MAG: acyltransferase [Ekhidna sp.]|nr:acyltransferase [Ekhidna sp.]